MSGGTLAALGYFGILNYSLVRDGLVGAFVCTIMIGLIEMKSIRTWLLAISEEFTETKLEAARVVGLIFVMLHLIVATVGELKG